MSMSSGTSSKFVRQFTEKDILEGGVKNLILLRLLTLAILENRNSLMNPSKVRILMRPTLKKPVKEPKKSLLPPLRRLNSNQPKFAKNPEN